MLDKTVQQSVDQIYAQINIDTASSNNYNVTANIPLTNGNFYTSTTARAAVPTTNRKLGLNITYSTTGSTWVTEQFIGSDVANWTISTNWKLTLDSTDLNIVDPNTISSVNLVWVTGSYYNKATGAVVANADWNRTELYTISGQIAITISGYTRDASKSSVLYFDINNNLIGEDLNFVNGSSYVNKILYPPISATKIGFTVYKTVSLTANSGVLIQLNALPYKISGLPKAYVDSLNFIDPSRVWFFNLTWESGYYNKTTGAKVADGYLKRTPMYDIGANNFALSTINYTRNSAAAGVIYFKSDGTILSEDSNLVNTMAYVNKVLAPPYLATKIAFVTYDITTFYVSVVSLIKLTDLDAKLAVLSSKYSGMNGLYIGDSISTDNNYNWKGYLEKYYNISYLRSISGQIPPAVGGITLIPPISEVSGHESIWWRCSSQRLVIYNPNIIFLFGGTNDETQIGLNLGASTDTAYLDTTVSRPDILTFCASLKGCVEMLQRDLPNAEIVICTVLDTSGYGGAMYDATYNIREAMAIRQTQVAVLYNLKCVPLFWDSGITARNTIVKTLDNIHPNQIGAKGITDSVRRILLLK